MRHIAVVGDIHGDVTRLQHMLRQLGGVSRIVFTGDYVDGGPSSAQVLQTLVECSQRDPGGYVFLLGNHERAFLRYLEDGNFAAYAALGGVSTIASYAPVVTGEVWPALTRAVPPAHRAFLRDLLPYWETDDVLISHAGFDPSRPDSRALDVMATMGGWPIFDAASYPKPLVVCRHCVQPNGPYVGEHLVCVDTGCGRLRGGALTALLLPEKTFVKV